MGASGENAVETSAGNRRFAAFISYSHADAIAAAKLQRKLERYRLPKRIAEAQSRSESLGTVFRDREDLAAASSLSAAIRNAIMQAEALIVICSAHAAASPWVGAEIELFRELHPDRPILAALVSDGPLESFPPALTKGGLEPLAADLRPEGDGPQLGFLKIVAGIAGVPLDALIQRDAQRRIRRVTAITVGALAAVLVMGVMTTFALQSRNEAARQRAGADGLVEYMLTDLRTKLKGVGRLDVMSAVNDRAMEHYRAQGDLNGLSANDLERRAQILHAMGEDDEKRGELAKAFVKFREAHRVTSALLARDPKNPDRIFTHAQSEYWVGYTALLNGNIALAEHQAAAYRKYGLQLSKMAGDRIVAQKEIGWAANLMGVVSLYGRKNANAAKGEFELYRAIFQKIVQERPLDSEAWRSLSMSHALLGEALEALGDHENAIVERKREQAIIDKLFRSDPANSELWMQDVIKNRSISRSLALKGDIGNSERYLQQAEEWSGKLAVLDPQNAEWRLQRALNLTVRVMLEKQSGHFLKLGAARSKLQTLRNDKKFLASLRVQDAAYFANESDRLLTGPQQGRR